MSILAKALLFLVSGLVVLILLIWIGLQIRPAPFPPVGLEPRTLETVPLPEVLPAPVERFYREIYGQEVPLIESAVISGRADMRIARITFPARFRFVHDAGQDYRHYIEATLFGLPVMKVNEFYIDGASRLELPFGVVEHDPKVNQAANLGLWAESIWLPAILITDPRVRWEPIDEATAVLYVPFGQDEEHFIARFDPETGLLHLLESMRWKDSADTDKTLWINEALEWDSVNGNMIPAVGAVTWFDEGTPWAVFRVEEIVYNVDVEEYIQVRGP